MYSDDASGNQFNSARALLHSAIQRLSAQSANCKLWAVILSAVVLLFAAGRAGGELLLWAAAPILLLAVADAGYAARAGVFREASLKSTSKNGQDLLNVAFSSGDMGDMVKSLAGFTVLPFYVLLLGMVGGLGYGVMVPKTKAAGSLVPQGMNPGAFGPGMMPQTGTPFTNSPPVPGGPRSQMPAGVLPKGPTAPGVSPGNSAQSPAPRVMPAPTSGNRATQGTAPGVQTPPGAPTSSLLLNKTRTPTPNVSPPQPPVLTPPGPAASGPDKPGGGDTTAPAPSRPSATASPK